MREIIGFTIMHIIRCFFGINMNITLYSFELIFYDVFDVYLLLIFYRDSVVFNDERI